MVKVKICGITNKADALQAVGLGTDMLGFIFVPSPRQITPDAAKDIVAGLSDSVLKVGVFMDQPVDEVKEIISFCGLDMAQLHGIESPGYCASLNCRLIKSFTPETLPPLAQLRNYPVGVFLLDKPKGSNAKPEALWPVAREMAPYGRLLLAGSLTPENVGAAIEAVQPCGVDVASGVERAPGKKDQGKMKDFIGRVKSI